MTAQERIDALRKAQDAAQAVVDEIENRNRDDINPFRQKQREPALQRARALISDTQRAIRDLEASLVGIELPAEDLARLAELEERLDQAIQTNALVGAGMAILTRALDAAEDVRTALR